jgi:exopolyphosphatase/guanosine-5'-triphosphate,3'-diphosphate pyrophosphatase
LTNVLAAVDVGTNSLHLVVARVTDEDHFEVVAREKETVRLGRGAGDMKRLAPDAIDRGVAALSRFRRIAEISEAPMRAVATSAVREAENHDEFIARAWREAGVDVEIISGVEEARLIHLGVLQALPVYDQQLLLCDIGGGSTELLIGERGTVLAARSLKLGAVRLTDRFFPSDGLDPSAVDSCRRHVQSVLAPFLREVERFGFAVAVGSSGTVQQVVKLSHAAAGAEPLRTLNGATLTRAELGRVVKAVVKASRAGTRSQLAGLEEKRSDIILAGVLILEGVFDACGIEELVVSDYALREGVLLDTIHRRRGGSLHLLNDVSRRSVQALVDACDDDPAHSAWVARLALELFDATAELHGLDNGCRDYLEAGALLANVGLFVSHAKHHKHSYYVIRNSERLVGFADDEIEIIAQVARYHRKSAPKARHPEFAALAEGDQHVVRTLAGLLRVAIGLDRSHRQLVDRVEVDTSAKRVVVGVVPTDGADLSLELYDAGERTGLLADVLARPVEVVAAPG